MFLVHALKTLFSSPVDDGIVIEEQYCVCALQELRKERLVKGLDPSQWMQIVKVTVLKMETSWATWIGIADRKEPIHVDISDMPLSQAADNFLVHLTDWPAGPDESAREHIHRTIPKAKS